MWTAKNFGHRKTTRAFAKESIEYTHGCEHGETYESCPEMVFINCKDYVERKLKMLRRDMFIEPTEDEVAHLYELENQWDIDRAVKSLIDKYWN